MENWVLLDTETDGLYSPIHVIEVAAQLFVGKEPKGKPFRIFINHGIEIPTEATAVHGYTTSFIKQNGVDPQSAYAELRTYVGNLPVVAHYLTFDWDRVLVPELFRLKLQPIGTRGFCSWMLSKRALPEHPTHRLDFLREQYQLHCSRAHTALGDVEAVTDLLTRVIFPRMAEIGLPDIPSISRFSTLRPLLACRCLIQGLSYEEEEKKVKEHSRKIREFKQKQESRQKFVDNVRSGWDAPLLPQLITDYNLIEESPEVIFPNRIFLFTGQLSWGKRENAQEELIKRGGLLAKSNSVSDEVDYLVLGEDKTKGWLSLSNGGKLRNAFIKKFEGKSDRLKIILESDFINALLPH